MAIPITTPLRTLAPRPFQSGACQTLAVSLAPRPSEPLVVALSRNNRAAKSAGIEFCDRQAHKQSASPNRKHGRTVVVLGRILSETLEASMEESAC
jgi:hypothetical protein